jgi:hypothetical protein
MATIRLSPLYQQLGAQEWLKKYEGSSGGGGGGGEGGGGRGEWNGDGGRMSRERFDPRDWKEARSSAKVQVDYLALLTFRIWC